jgi:hypothetical protein
MKRRSLSEETHQVVLHCISGKGARCSRPRPRSGPRTHHYRRKSIFIQGDLHKTAQHFRNTPSLRDAAARSERRRASKTSRIEPMPASERCGSMPSTKRRAAARSLGYTLSQASMNSATGMRQVIPNSVRAAARPRSASAGRAPPWARPDAPERRDWVVSGLAVASS